jgi:hypothetical protein
MIMMITMMMIMRSVNKNPVRNLKKGTTGEGEEGRGSQEIYEDNIKRNCKDIKCEVWTAVMWLMIGIGGILWT